MVRPKARRRVVGMRFYKEKGLKPLVLHVPPEVHEALRGLAFRAKVSLQKAAVHILTEAVLPARRAK